MLSRPARASGEFDCPRCGVLLLYRKEKSLQRTWALLVAAAILYVPANVLIHFLFATKADALFQFARAGARWSMLDLFVVALLVGLVQLRGVATIRAEAGAIAFAAVVILTMYATQAFDPRLMWDRAPQ